MNILYKLKALLHNISWGGDKKSAEIRLEISKTILHQVLDLVWQLKSSTQLPPWQISPSDLEHKRSLSDALSGVLNIVRAVSVRSAQSMDNEWQEFSNRRYKATNDEYDRRLWMLFSHLKASRQLAQGNDMIDGIFLSKVRLSSPHYLPSIWAL